MPDSALPVTKPVSVWNRSVQVDCRALFQALTTEILRPATGQPPLIQLGRDLLSALNLGDRPPEEIAYRLIQSALAAALSDLTMDAQPLPYDPGDPELLLDELDLSLEEMDLEIDRTFLERPAEFSLVREMRVPLSQWLQAFGLDQSQARKIANRLPRYFVFSLLEEWRRDPDRFEPLRQALDGPVAQAAQRQQEWISYQAWLERELDQPLFGEAFSIRDVHVPLRASKDCTPTPDTTAQRSSRPARPTTPDERLGNSSTTRLAVDVHDEVHNWLSDARPGSFLRLLLGGPGSGKSTTAKVLAAEVMNQNERLVVLVPLNLVDPSAGLMRVMERFVTLDRILTVNPLDSNYGEKKLLIILDGLDELAYQGASGADEARRFLARVQNDIESMNRQDNDIRALITARPLALPQESPLRPGPEQLLYILPYTISSEARKDFQNADSELLLRDQRQIWWKKYSESTGRDLEDDLLERLDEAHLGHLTSQPLFNCLLALLHQRDRLRLSDRTSLNQVYREVVQEVYDRRWDPRGEHPAVEDLDPDTFFLLLEEVAVTMWLGQGRTASIRDIQQRLESIGHEPLAAALPNFHQLPAGRLLLGFYFQRTARRLQGEATFEFSHASFGDYLVARRIVRTATTFADHLNADNRNADHGWNEQECLIHWTDLCGPTPLDSTTLDFIQGEAALRASTPDQAIRCQHALAQLLSHVQHHSFPMEQISPPLPYREMNRQATNSEEALLLTLNSFARATKTPSTVHYPNKYSFRSMLWRLGGGYAVRPYIVFRSLSYFDLPPGRALRNADLTAANLQNTSLVQADLRMVNLTYAKLEDSNLLSADFYRATLEGASLVRADLRRTSLVGTNLRDSDLSAANLGQAVLKPTAGTFRSLRADLLGSPTNLDMANLSNTKARKLQSQRLLIRHAHLLNARLERSYLLGADFSGSDLTDARLDRCNLVHATFKGATLTRVRLRRAVLRKADFTGAILRDADLRCSICDSTQFSGASLRGTDLRKTDLRKAEGLTANQLRSAILDDTTRLPWYLRHVMWEG